MNASSQIVARPGSRISDPGLNDQKIVGDSISFPEAGSRLEKSVANKKPTAGDKYIKSKSLSSANNQKRAKTSKLAIGDQIPEVLIPEIINSRTTSIRISSFKGKLLILDFMSTRCASCIEALPKFDSIQKKHGSQVQIMIVTPEDSRTVKAFISKNKYAKNTSLPFVVNDSKLKSFFPHQFISHLAWIGANGKVVAITAKDYLTPGNVEKVLSGIVIDWPVKNDVDFDHNKSLTVIDNANLSGASYPAISFQSSFTSYLDGVNSRYLRPRLDSGRNQLRLLMINLPIIEMYQRALKVPPLQFANRMILQVKDSARFLFDPSKHFRAEWRQENTFCYEALFPAGTSLEQIHKKWVTDLDLYLQCMGIIEERCVPVYVLTSMEDRKDLIEAKKISFTTKVEEGYQRIEMKSLLFRLNNLSSIPILDETNYRDELLVPIDLSDEGALSESLRKQGFLISRQERDLKMFILTQQ